MKHALRDIDGCVLIAKYSPSGEQIAVAGGGKAWDDSGFVHVYDAKTLAKQYERKHLFKITCLDWSPDGNHLAYGGSEGIIFVWHPKTDTLLSYMDHSPELAHLSPISQPRRREIYALAWVANTPMVTSVGDDGCMRLWHAESGMTDRVMYSEDITDGFTYAPGGRLAITPGIMPIMSASSRVHAVVFDVLEERAMFSLLHESPYASSFVWTPQGIPLLALRTDSQIQIWDLGTVRQYSALHHTSYQPLDLYEPPANSLAWSPNAEHLACCGPWSWEHHSNLTSQGRGWSRAVVEVKSITTGATQYTYAVTDPYCLDWAPQGDQLIVGEAGGFEILSIGS